MKRLDGLQIAVTGASGFIGSRVVEYFALRTKCKTTAIVRAFSRLGRLAELPQSQLRFAVADVLDIESMRAAFEGCDVVVHCAFGSDGDDVLRSRTTVEGTRAAVQAARECGVARFVNVSTAAVHDTRGLTVVSEDAPVVVAPKGSYEVSKYLAEEIVAESGLESMSLRPAVVYGPWGKDWTQVVLERLRMGTSGLPSADRASGVCNLVFVDDVARAIVAACAVSSTGPVLISGAESVSWGRFYDGFRGLLPGPISTRGPAAEAWELELYADQAQVDVGRARELLDWQPLVGFEQGIERVGAWARWSGVLDGPVRSV